MRPPEENAPSAGANKSPLRSFGRRRGRKLSSRQSSLLSEGLERLKLDFRQPPARGDLGFLFPDPVRETWLEIGFGAGEHLIWQAAHNADVGLIGAEPYVNGVVAALSAAEAQGLQGRLRLHAEDVHPLLDWLPSASLARAFMLFPDPWPKTRHKARRLFSPALLDSMARVLRPDAEFRFASDIADYADAAIALGEHHPCYETANIFTSATRTSVADWPVTRYEVKAMREGRPASFLILRRK